MPYKPSAGWGSICRRSAPGPRLPAHRWHSSHASHFHVARLEGQAGHVGTCRIGWGLLLSPFLLLILSVAAGQHHETYWPHRVHTLQGVRIRAVLLNRGDCAPSKHLATSRDTFSHRNWGGIEGTETRDAAKDAQNTPPSPHIHTYNRLIWPQMSTAPSVRSPGLGRLCCPHPGAYGCLPPSLLRWFSKCKPCSSECCPGR